MCSHAECYQIVSDGRWLPHFSLQIARSSSWHARYTVLTYLQIMVFYNLFTFMSDQKSVNDVRALVIQLLEDEQLEVKHPSPKFLRLFMFSKVFKVKKNKLEDIRTNTRQPVFLMFKRLLASLMLAGTFAVFQRHCSDSALSSRLSTTFLPLWFSSCCYGNHWLQ